MLSAGDILHQTHGVYIGGEFLLLPSVRNVHDPATGEVVGAVAYCGRTEATQAVEAADCAFSAWSRQTAEERSVYLRRWAELIRAHRDEIAKVVTLEQGKPLAEAVDEVEGAAKFVEWYAEEAKRVAGEMVPASARNKRIMVWRQPVGVCGLITPWNYPASMVTRKMAPALAAGCTAVLKPALQTPLTAVFLFRLLHEAGFPPGVANLVTGNAAEIGEVFMHHPRVRKVSFTGSTEVGKQLIRQSADQVKRLSLELGGNAPLIIFPDADLDAAVEGAVGNKFENAGQMCNGINVLYVHADVAAPFIERLSAKVRALRVGHGLAQETQMGPLIDHAAVDRVHSLVQAAVEQGARILTGGCPLTGDEWDRGSFYAPTVLVDVTPEMRIAQEEIFGPVAPIVVFRDEASLLRTVNASPYGLAAYVYTRDVARVFETAEALEFGMVAVNGTSLSVPQAPFGGVKESGEGREGGHFGIEEYLHVKYVSLTLEH